jgi:hypothetical protein
VDTSKAKGKAKFRGSYVWNLFSLPSLLPTQYDENTEREYIISPEQWKPIWIENYNDDSGSDVFDSAKTLYTMSQFNVPRYNQQRYSGSFTISPFITLEENDSETLDAEKILYAASVIPGYPLMTASSFGNHTSYGPVFFSNIKFDVSGRSTIGAVDISCNFIGGKILSDPNLSKTKPNLTEFSPKVDIFQTANDELQENYKSYRKANLLDCLISFSTVTDKDKLYSNTIKRIDPFSEPELKLIGMTLNIAQQVSLVYTTPQDSYLNYYGDKIGPKYAEITDRKVTGTITFYSTEREIYLNNTGSLTLYFGNDFLFPFDDVEWQKPRFSAKELGYEHEYSFIARVAKNSLNVPDPKYKNFPVSEFAIDYNKLI